VRFSSTAATVASTLLPLVCAAAVTATPHAVEPPRASLAWVEMAPGASRAEIVAAAGATKILLYRFALAQFRADVVVGAGWPPARETAAALVRRRAAVAAVNGGFFDERGAPLGLRIASGRKRAPLRPKADWGVLVLGEAGARIVHTRELAGRGGRAGVDDSGGAIQVGPRLLVAGQPLQLKPQIARRTAVALERSGEALTLVVVDEPIDANELAQSLASAGFDSALLLDGGPSTQLSVAVGDARADVPGGYPVPDLLVIVPRPAR
jgi:uncharacterized protein YigE (DUF2233 family)